MQGNKKYSFRGYFRKQMINTVITYNWKLLMQAQLTDDLRDRIANIGSKRTAEADAWRDMILDKLNKRCNLAVTLTLDNAKLKYRRDRKALFAIDAGVKQRNLDNENIDMIVAKELKFIRDKINAVVYGSNWRRKNKRVIFVGIKELKTTDAHLHLALHVPVGVHIGKVAQFIEKEWSNVWLGGKHNKAELITNEFDWTQYITKHFNNGKDFNSSSVVVSTLEFG